MAGTHDHDHGYRDSQVKKRLSLAVKLTAIIFVAELVGGYMTNSLALISDAMHVFMDMVALSLSFFAIFISAQPPTETRTYGMHRAEVFVSFLNGASLVLVSIFIIYKAYFRFLNPAEVEGIGMLVIAVIGLIVNVLVAFWLHDFAKDDLNVKSAFLHVVGDLAASVGVIIAAIVISFTGWNTIDPLISVLIGVIILYGSGRIVLEASHILLEGVPRGIEFSDVLEDITSVKGVTGVHNMNIWSICHNINALSAHVGVDERRLEGHAKILAEINEMLAEKHHISYTTVQIECSRCDDCGGVLREVKHSERREHKCG
ncbi:Cobalt-zinc-cadmium resistance protein CzcD [hydrothermal vent metagenome]|uniref:Cobalt-zinc-cadmium resistance protein CzcD n=1 Tax=hydrothermal vent metagenome TaxID=652676 RepID=A0A3B0QV30_9ZZZZ